MLLSERVNNSALSMPTLPGLGHDYEQPGSDIKADADVITANKSIAGRNAHSVAADPTNELNLSTGPLSAGVSTICSSTGCNYFETVASPSSRARMTIRLKKLADVITIVITVTETTSGC